MHVEKTRGLSFITPIAANSIKFDDWSVLYHVPLWEVEEAVLPKERVCMCLWGGGVLFLEEWRAVRNAAGQSYRCLSTPTMQTVIALAVIQVFSFN